MQEAMRLNPSHPKWYLGLLGIAQYIAHDYEGAVETLKKMSPIGIYRIYLAAMQRGSRPRTCNPALRLQNGYSGQKDGLFRGEANGSKLLI